MPKTWQPHSPEIRTTSFYTIPVALRKVGDRHPRPLLPRQRSSKVLDSSRRLLYQVDRGQTPNHHHSPASPTICLEGYYMPIWCPTYHYHRQFIDKELAKFYTGLGIKHITSSVEHPQTNGQAEAANQVILVELRKRLDSAKGRWPKELVEVMWAYKCTPQSATNESPFSLVYGADAMIPVEIGEPSLRRELYDSTYNHQNMATHLDLLSELREKVQIRNLAAKQRVATKYNAKLCPRSFAKRDLVWRMASSARKKDAKFSANWDGPYRIREDAREEHIGLNSYLGKKYLTHGMYPI